MVWTSPDVESPEQLARARKSRAAKRKLYEQFAKIGKALASPARLELLDLLVQGERSVEGLATETQLSTANASQHLQVLARARLIDSRRDGQRVLYRLADPSVETLWQTLRHTAERRLAELESVARDYLLHRDELEPINRTELIRRMAEGTVTLLDVRPREEFAQGHLPGALSVPLDQLATWVKSSAEPPSSMQIVAYCRGPYCVWALQAVALLTEQGIRAVRLREGVGEWRAAELPIERASQL